MVGNVIRIEVDWESHLLQAGWLVRDNNPPRTYLFSKLRLCRIPHDLRDSRLQRRFRILLQKHPRFTAWWHEACGDRVDKLFLFRFPDGAWDLPWELLLKDLELTELRQTVSFVRSLAQAVPLAPSSFDEPLRILILKGDNGEDIGQKIDLDAEARGIQAAWKGLEYGMRQCIEEPRIEPGVQGSISTLLSEYKPHVLWFSGHGETKDKTRLLLADKKWVSALELANRIRQSGRPPLYAVFWACDTGRPARVRTSTVNSPSLFNELTKVGILAVLAMQSPIGDKNARFLAEEVFRFLASGFPLERAVARARVNLMLDSPQDPIRPFDWASPVVWTTSEVVDHLSWNRPPQPLAQLQLLGRQTMRWRLKRPAELEGLPSVQEQRRAEVWVTYSRVWVVEDLQGEEQYRWTRTLQAVQSQTRYFTIAIDIRSADSVEGLQEWARSIYSRMLPGDFDEKIARIISEIARTPISGWKKLCSLDNLYLAIANPPIYRETDWFWEPLLLTQGAPKSIILSNQPISKDIERTWILDRLTQTMDEQTVVMAIGKAPRLARALAVLDMPLGSSYISVQAEQGDGAQSLVEWPEGRRILIETPAGPILPAMTRQLIRGLEPRDSQLWKKAHSDCVKMLGHPDLFLTPEIREKRLEHLLECDLPDAAIYASEEATTLCYLYQEGNRPFDVIKVVERLSKKAHDVPLSCRLHAAWAYLQLGKLAQARIYLDRSIPRDKLEIAWKHGLQAEIYKSIGQTGAKEAALDEIDRAIQICEAATRDPQIWTPLARRRVRAYRQDRARLLQYIFYKIEDAAAEYQRLVGEWSDQSEAPIDLAVVKRNYAECLRCLATNVDDQRYGRAWDLLQEAEALARRFPQAPVLSEVLYEKAKMAEIENKYSQARQYLLDCQEAARQSYHFLMNLIAEARHFWRYETFRLGRWEEIEAELSTFPHHGWSLRTLIDGRLRTARWLEQEGDLQGSFNKLTANQKTLEENPSFNEGSDRFRIAATLAGLQVIGQKLNLRSVYWADFTSAYSWAETWLERQGINTPEVVWSKV